MKPNNVPERFLDVLELAERADVLMWSRCGKRLNLILDDKVADRRTCVDISLEHGRGSIRTLRGFNHVKDCWGDYCSPSEVLEMPDMRGLKALNEYVSRLAVQVTHFPNPECFSFYRSAASSAFSTAA